MCDDPPIEIPGSSEYAMREVAAERLAYQVAKAIQRRSIGSRSAISDALLDYLGVDDVPKWIESYERKHGVPTMDDGI